MQNKKTVRTLRALLHRVQKEQLGLYAAQASFFLIISLVPLLMLLLPLVQFILPIEQNELIELLKFYLPEGVQSFLLGIVRDLYPTQTVSIISVSTLVLLWSASRGVHSVTQGLKHIFRVPKDVYYKERLRALFYTVAFLLTVFFVLIVLVFGSSIWSIFLLVFPLLKSASITVALLKYLVSAILITLFALLLYCATAEKPLSSARIQFPGALLAAAGWVLFSTGFSLYLTNFAKYSYIYGSLAAIIFLMLWLYICMWLLFLGAEINRLLYLSHKYKEKKKEN